MNQDRYTRQANVVKIDKLRVNIPSVFLDGELWYVTEFVLLSCWSVGLLFYVMLFCSVVLLLFCYSVILLVFWLDLLVCHGLLFVCLLVVCSVFPLVSPLLCYSVVSLLLFVGVIC